MAAREGIAQIGPGYVRYPIVESAGARIGVNAAALEQVDQQLMHKVHVAAELEGVGALDLAQHIGKLQAMLVRESGARQRVWHPVGEEVRDGNARASRIGSDPLQVPRPLKADLIDGGGIERRTP